MKRNVINTPVVLGSCIALVLCGFGVTGLHSWQLSRIASGLLTHAEISEKDSRWIKSAEFLDRYLRIKPNDAAVRGRLALTYAKHVKEAKGLSSPDEKKRAVDLCYRAIGAGHAPDEKALRSHLSSLLLEIGRLLEAEKEAQILLQLDSTDPLAHRALAIALFAQLKVGSLPTERLAEVHLISKIEDAYAKNPNDIDLAEIAASLYREHVDVVRLEFANLTETERQSRGDAHLDHLINNVPSSAAAYLARYRYRTRNRLSNAEADLEHALTLEPEDPDVLLTAAFAALKAGAEYEQQNTPSESLVKYVSARKYFEALNSRRDRDFGSDVLVGLGDACLKSSDLNAALKTWREGLRRYLQSSAQATFHGRIADALIEANRDAEAADSLSAINSILASAGTSIPRDIQLSLLQSQDLRQASLAIKRARYQEAIQSLQRVVSRQSEGKKSREIEFYAWNQLGRSFAALDEWIDAGVAFDHATAIQPQAPAPRLAAAHAWFNAGRPEMAADRADVVNKIQSSFESWMILAASQFQMQVSLSNSERSWTRLEEAFRAIALVEVPTAWRAALLQAEYFTFRGRTEGDVEKGRLQAKATLDAAFAKHVKAPEFLKRLPAAYENLGFSSDADDVVSQMQLQKLTPVAIALAQARLYVIRKEYQRATAALEAAGKSATGNDREILWSELLYVAEAAEDFQTVERLLEAQLVQHPNELKLLRQRCELLIDRKDFKGLAYWQSRLSSAGAVGKVWSQYYEVMRLYLSAKSPKDNNLTLALAAQESLAEARPNWPRSLVLRGMIKERLEEWEEAAAAYEGAIQLGVSQASVFERLIVVLERLNRSGDAEKYLSRLESYLPFSQRLTEFASGQEFRRNPGRAIAIAREAVAKRPDDPQSRVWLGRLLLVNNELVEAEQEFKRGVETSNDVRAWTGLFSFYLRTGAVDKARATLTELSTRAKLGDAERDFVLAQGLEQLGDWDQAATKYRAAADQSPTNALIQLRLAGVYLRNDPLQAIGCLRKAIQLDPELAPARRMLAAILASRGTDAEMREAEDLLSKINGPNSAPPVEDRRLRALLLAQRGSGENTGRAIQLLEDIVFRGTSSLPGDHIILAQLYEHESRSAMSAQEAASRLKSARQQLVTLSAREEPHPNHLIALIEFLLRNNQKDDATSWIEKLESKVPASGKPDVVLMGRIAELRLKHGSLPECGKWIDRVAAEDADPMRPIVLRAKLIAAQTTPQAAVAYAEPSTDALLQKTEEKSVKILIIKAIGDLCSDCGSHDRAEHWYRRLADLDQKQFPLVIMALASQKRAKDAVMLCVEQAKTDRTSRYAVVASAVLADLSPPAEVHALAEPLIQSALKNYPEDMNLLYSVGTLYVVQGKYDESVAIFRKLLSINPRHVPALNNLALILAESPTKRTEALSLIDQAISLMGSHPGLLDTKGAILVYDGKSEQALPLLEIAARGAKVDPRHNLHLAAAYRDTANDELARDKLKLALDRELESLILTRTDQDLLVTLRNKLGL